MISVQSSPMSVFGGGSTAFETGRQIGRANSPFSTVGEAMKNTIDMYNEEMARQRAQADKVALANSVSDRAQQNATALEQYKYDLGTPAAKQFENWNEDPSLAENQVMVGGVPMYYEAVKDKWARKIGRKLKNPRAMSMFDMINGGTVGGTVPSTEGAGMDPQAIIDAINAADLGV